MVFSPRHLSQWPSILVILHTRPTPQTWQTGGDESLFWISTLTVTLSCGCDPTLDCKQVISLSLGVTSFNTCRAPVLHRGAQQTTGWGTTSWWAPPSRRTWTAWPGRERCADDDLVSVIGVEWSCHDLVIPLLSGPGLYSIVEVERENFPWETIWLVVRAYRFFKSDKALSYLETSEVCLADLINRFNIIHELNWVMDVSQNCPEASKIPIMCIVSLYISLHYFIYLYII